MSISYAMSFQELQVLNDNELFFVNAGGTWADIGNALITVGLGIVAVSKGATLCKAIVAGTVTFGVVGAAVAAVGVLAAHVYTAYC
jgi:hypothetical protein